MTGTLEDYEGIVCVGGRTITNFRFADDIDGIAGEEEELAKLVELNLQSLQHGDQCREDQADDNTSSTSKEIKVNGQTLETVRGVKHLGWVVSDEASKPEIT